MNQDEFNAATIEVENQRLQLEKERHARESSFFSKHFGAILTAGVSVLAIVVSGAQVMVADIRAEADRERAQIERDRENQRLENERTIELQREVQKALREEKQQLATLAIDKQDILFSNDEERVQKLLDIIKITYSAEAVEPFLAKFSESERQVAVSRDYLVEQRKSVAKHIAPRVYFHISSNMLRDRAKELAAVFEKDGFIVPGIELKEGSVKVSQVRYFREHEREDAEAIVMLLKRQGIKVKLVDLSERYGKATNIRARHYELWLGPVDIN